jgi:hypothetical protein
VGEGESGRNIGDRTRRTSGKLFPANCHLFPPLRLWVARTFASSSHFPPETERRIHIRAPMPRGGAWRVCTSYVAGGGGQGTILGWKDAPVGISGGFQSYDEGNAAGSESARRFLIRGDVLRSQPIVPSYSHSDVRRRLVLDT